MAKPRTRRRAATSDRGTKSAAGLLEAPPAAGVSTFEPHSHSETFATLLRIAHGETLRIPPAILVQHVTALPGDADWPVRRAAMEALLRRCGFAARDRLRVAVRPPRGAVFGTYRTRRPRERERPYTTWLTALDPIRGSCNCPDYVRSSLGICKHMIAVLDDLARQPRRLERAQSGAPSAMGPQLAWDPVRPLLGPGDWLARVRWIGYDGQVHAAPAEFKRARRWFQVAADGELAANAPDDEHLEQRASMVDDLWQLTRRDGRRGRAALAVEPALGALLDAERHRLERLRADRADRPALEQTLRSLHRRLYPYQTEGVRRFLHAGRLLLADDMGLGKTVQGIAACHALWHGGKVRRGLLIVPASLKSQWKREWQLFTDVPLVIVEGGPGDRQRAYQRRHPGFLVVNYEQVLRDLPALQAWDPELIVLDEAQRIKNWATRTAACVKQMRPPYRLVLTGTPMENRLAELASIFEWVDDHALEPKWRLVPWHSTYCDGKRETSGARHLDTLRARLAPNMLRRVRREILHQLPPRTDTVVPVELTEEQRDEHDALSKPIAQLVALAQRRPLTQAEFLKLMTLLTMQRMIANGLAQTRFEDTWARIGASAPDPALIGTLHSPKLLELREIVAQVALQQQRKVVVFSQWRRMLTLAHWCVRDLLAAGGVRAAFFTGKENPRQRDKSIVEFHDNPRVRILFATDAGGVGLNLQRAATCCVNIEMPWNPAVLEQRVGRIFRMGQRHPIDVYNLVAQDCIEARIAMLVADKRALFTGLFDGQSDEVQFERSGSFMATVQRLLEPAAAAPARKVAPPAREEAESAADSESLGEAAAERELDALVTAATEPSAEEFRPAPEAAAPVPAAAAAAPRAPARRPEPLSLAAPEVRALFSQLEIRPTPQGGIRIEASPAAAATLAALFEGLAGMLRASDQARETSAD